jgi:hypothetical protein
MLNRVNPNIDRHCNAADTVAVSRDRQARSVGRLNDQPHVSLGELRHPERERRCHRSACDHDLHDVTATLHAISDCSGEVVRALALASEVPAVATGWRNRWACSGDRCDIRISAQTKSHEAAITEVADRGDTAFKGKPSVCASPVRERRIVDIADLLFECSASVEDKVLVTVDQAGQQGDIAQIAYLD